MVQRTAITLRMRRMTMLVAAVLLVVMEVGEAAAGRCSSSCLVQQDIISCRRFDRLADIRACARHHPSATVLDLSYIDVQHPLTRRSLSRLRHIVVLYLDDSRVRRVDGDALAGMRRLRTVLARRMRGALWPLLDAVVAAPAVRQVALADNFVVCSCSWLRAVERLASVDVVIVDLLDAAPKCSDETVRRCRADSHTASHATNASPDEANVEADQSTLATLSEVINDDRRSSTTHRGFRRDARMDRHHRRRFSGGQTQRRHRRSHRQRDAASVPQANTTPSTQQGGTTCPGTIVLLLLLILVAIFIVVFFVTPLKYKLVRPPAQEDDSKKKSKSKPNLSTKVKFAERRVESDREQKSPQKAPEPPTFPTQQQPHVQPPSKGISTEPAAKTTPPEDVSERTHLMPSAEANINQSRGATDDRPTDSRDSIRRLFNLSALRRQVLAKSNNSNNRPSSDEDDQLTDGYYD